MTDRTSAIQTGPRPHRDEQARTFAPYAQLVKMLVPSSGCIAVYDTAGELVWCSDGYERPDLREVVDGLEARDAGTAEASEQIMTTASGITAYATALKSEGGAALGCVVVELGERGGRAATGSMAPSLLRPVLECLVARMALEQASAAAQASPADDWQVWLEFDDPRDAGAGALERLVAHCVENLECASGAFLVPERNISIIANRSAADSAEAAQLLEKTQKHLLAWAQLNNRPMVVNRVGAEAGLAPYKILSCPVRDPEQRVTGLMALFRSGEAPNFEIRDVRILEYMTRKALSTLNSEHDVLTGLSNQPPFERRVRECLVKHDGAHTMLYLDIDRLQLINDTFGFHAGDEVIQRLAEVIRGAAGDTKTCRLSGDRFALFLPNRSEKQAREAAHGIVRAMASLGYMKGADAVPVSVSIGLAAAEGRDYDHLIVAAEIACKRAREAGGNRVEVYGRNPTVSARRESDLAAAAGLRHALHNSELRLQAQAIVDLFNEPGKVLGYEILVRMRETSGTLVSAGKLVAAAERYGLMPALDKWVVAATMKILQSRAESLLELPLGVALNVSAQSLAQPDFPRFVLAEMAAAGLPPEAFCFEIKESAAVNRIADAERFIKSLTEAGCHVSLDDFGRGLTSLAHLKRLKVSYLKIDGHLIRRVLDDIHAESLVRGLAKAAQTLGIPTVAEHVESAAIAQKLQQLEIDLAQGYHFGHPRPLAEALAVADAASPGAGAGVPAQL